MTRAILLSLLLSSLAFADYEDTARACRAACAKVPDEAKRVECTRKCWPLGVADADDVADKPKKPAPTPPPKPEPAPDCNRTASCQCDDPKWDRRTPCDPTPH